MARLYILGKASKTTDVTSQPPNRLTPARPARFGDLSGILSDNFILRSSVALFLLRQARIKHPVEFLPSLPSLFHL